MQASPSPTIFVSIASYRDPDLLNTLVSLFGQARDPARLRVGICLQRAASDLDCVVPDEILQAYGAQIRLIEVDAAESKGACWARAQVLGLLADEDYYFQIDSHMRFVAGWDERLLRMLALCPSPRNVLSTYPLAFTPPDRLAPEQLVTMRPKGFDLHGVLTLNSTLSALEQAPALPAPTPFVSAGMLFGPADCMREVPYDPYLYFEGEEITLALRLWTHGWDIRQPNRAIAFHNYGQQPERPRHWKDQSRWVELNRQSRERIAALLGLEQRGSSEALRELASYGLGQVRTLAEYEQFSQIDFAARLYRGQPAMAPLAMADAEAQVATRRRVFADIWRRNVWGSGETRSGHGSTLAATGPLRTWLQRSLRFLNVRILADAGCGDLNWMRQLVPDLRFYFGYDIVPDLITDLREQFADQRRMSFAQADIVIDTLPECDAILCRDCLTHLPLDAALMALKRFRESGARFLIATTSEGGVRNRWLPAGYWHPVDLQAAPFKLPPPHLVFNEGGSKRLGVWALEDCPE